MKSNTYNDVLICSRFNSCTKDGQTPLHVAATEDQTEAIELLSRAGADINAGDAVSKSILNRNNGGH